MRCLDPATMNPVDRLAELGELLAAGIQRFLARERKARMGSGNREEQLDVGANVEAPCGTTTECPA